MHEIVILLGIQSWKPVFAALALPPVPWLILTVVGARALFWRRGLGWLLILLSCAGIWLSCSSAVGVWLERVLTKPPPPLTPNQIAALKRDVAAGKKLAIVILGGGRDAIAPEYGLSVLTSTALQRLHYAVWLSKQTGAPMLYSGGVGHESGVGVTEAETAARIAEQDYGRPIMWLERESRDTRENATRSVAMLKENAIAQAVLVSHGYHMKRALRAFESESERVGIRLTLVPAPMGSAQPGERATLAWLPSRDGFSRVHVVLREYLGYLLGA